MKQMCFCLFLFLVVLLINLPQSACGITPTQLVFTEQPKDTQAFSTIHVEVGFFDSTGHLVTDVADTINMFKLSGPGSLSGTLTAPTINGVATFDNITIHQAGLYSLHAHASISGFDAASVIFKIKPHPTPEPATLLLLDSGT
jgi:hypothetical protein